MRDEIESKGLIELLNILNKEIKEVHKNNKGNKQINFNGVL